MITKRIQVYNDTSVDPNPYLVAMFHYYQKHGVTLNYDILKTNVAVPQSIVSYNSLVGSIYVVRGVETLLPQTDHEIALFFYPLDNWKAPWYWPWPLWGNVPRDCTYVANGKPFVTIGYWPTDQTVAQRFLHEPMHALAMIFGCQDQLDTYINDSNPDAPVGNFASQWAIFQPFLKAPAMPPITPTRPVAASSAPTVTITRISDNGTETIGSLVAQNNGATFACSTLERPWKDNETNVSCIPKGTYSASVQTFHAEQRYELGGTSPRTGIFIHEMNYYSQSEGCIGLGVKPSDLNGDGQVDVTASANTVNSFMTFMQNKPFSITIK